MAGMYQDSDGLRMTYYLDGFELENNIIDVSSSYPQVMTCEGSRGYGKSISEEVIELETKIDCLQKEIDKLEKKMEEKEMKNDVLELWYSRQLGEIYKEYDEKEIEFNKSKELVIKYNDIVDRFENELKQLYESEENIESKYIKDALSGNSMYKYKVDYDKLRDEFLEKYISERNDKVNELDDKYKEIKAILSLSNDADYQLDVLKNYGIIDKKTKKMAK